MHSRRRILALGCTNIKKTYISDPRCYECHSHGEICGVSFCLACGFAILRQCTGCNTRYCNKCGQNPSIRPLPQLDPAVITLDGATLNIFDESGLATSATIFVNGKAEKTVSCDGFVSEPLEHLVTH
jgi:hypothetical protein